MTPQSNFMVLALVRPDQMGPLKSLLESMTGLPGMANPKNPIVPFERFENIHYARFVILDDRTLCDLAHFGVPVPEYQPSLAFLGDCDGPAEACLEQLANGAGDGLRQIFSHCGGFDSNSNLLAWMKDHSQPTAAAYVNWIGRTVRQVREEAALRERLLQYLEKHPPAVDDPQAVRDELIAAARADLAARALTLTPPEPTPANWRVRNLLHCSIVPAGLVLLLLFLPLTILGLAIFAWLLRRYEKTEPEVVVRPPPDHGVMLARLEDHDVTNQFTVVGSVKPGLFRRVTLAVILWLIDYGARHIYNRGRLGRIQTIHFARWAFLDGKQRVLFASNYDGSLESYMDDFINKVGWGLNLVFSNGVGYPRTRWLVRDGSKSEQQFKYTLRRHQLPTQVWYRAYPGLTAFDIARNARVRQGIEQTTMTDDEIRRWLRDL